MSAFELTDTVEVGATNDPTDVRALKRRLNGLGFDWIEIDATADEELRQVINLFQSITSGRNRVDGDGTVTVPANWGWMYSWLRADNAPGWQRMPAGEPALGFLNHERADPTDDHGYGTSWIAETIRGAGAYYRDNYLADHPTASPISINDVSRRQGGHTPDHTGHETGIACDLRLPRSDGTTGGIRVEEAAYDQDAMRGILRAFRMQPKQKRVLFSDRTLAEEGLCIVPDNSAVRADHRNHAHVEINPLFPLTGYDKPFENLLLEAVETFGGTLVNPFSYEMTVEGFASYLADVGINHFTAEEVVTAHHETVAKDLGYESLLPPRRWWTRAAAHVALADELRATADEPVWMRNYWRPPDYNEHPTVDGATRSDHIPALAVDLDFTSVSGKEAAERRFERLRTEHAHLRLRYVTYDSSPKTIHVTVLSPKGTGHVDL